MFSITERSHGQWRVLVVHGAVDLASAPQLRSRARQAAAGASLGIVLDLSDVEFVDSVGIGVLLGLRRRLAKIGASLMIVGLGGPARIAFETTGVIDLFTEVGGVSDLDD